MELNDIKEVLSNECYDIVEDLGEEKVVKIVKQLVDQLYDPAKAVISIGKQVSTSCGRFSITLCNRHKGFVSVSNCNRGNTSVSRTEFYPYYFDSDDRLAGLTNLVEMINEAYYDCVNG